MSILPYPDRLTAFARRIARTLLPGSCLLCGADSPDDLLCNDCSADLPALPLARCPLCADQTTHGERCGACLKDPPHFDQAIAAFAYDFPLDRIVHALKYGHQLAVADWCARQLVTRLDTGGLDCVVPLPLHPERLCARGFNQSGEIAKVLASASGLPVRQDSLLRTRATATQAELLHKERRRNVGGAFECRTDFSGKRLLLVDDVMTTAATANECARVLKLHGARAVTVAVVARALKH